MTAAEHEAAYKASLAETERLKRQWHDALIAESPFRVGDRVLILPERRQSMIVRMFISDQDSVVHQCAWFGLVKYAGADYLTRIDEHGNPLPPRG